MGVALASLPFVRGLVEDWVLDRDLVGYRIAVDGSRRHRC